MCVVWSEGQVFPDWVDDIDKSHDFKGIYLDSQRMSEPSCGRSRRIECARR